MSPLLLKWQPIIDAILCSYIPDRRVLLFGSRAQGRTKKYSDIDLCIMGETPVSAKVMSELREAFASSDIPVRVDVVDWATTSLEFRKNVTQHSTQIYPH